MLAVPVAGACGIALPGCECGSVPIANRLMDRGVRPSAALAFLLSAPAINPIVLVATAVAFQSDTRMVWARLAAGLLTAVVVGLIWERIGKPEWMRPTAARIPEPRGGRSRAVVFLETIRGDFTQAAGFLVIGAAAAATLNVVVPREKMTAIGSSLALSIILMALLAFILAICSEADAFVAASFTPIPMVGQAGLPDGRPCCRRQAGRHADRHLRPAVRDAIRPADLRGRRDGRHRRRPAGLGAVRCPGWRNPS